MVRTDRQVQRLYPRDTSHSSLCSGILSRWLRLRPPPAGFQIHGGSRTIRFNCGHRSEDQRLNAKNHPPNKSPPSCQIAKSDTATKCNRGGSNVEGGKCSRPPKAIITSRTICRPIKEEGNVSHRQLPGVKCNKDGWRKWLLRNLRMSDSPRIFGLRQRGRYHSIVTYHVELLHPFVD